MRVLLADDDPDVLEPLAMALRREGLEVCAASDGTRAWDLFTTEHPDVVVLDLTMPGLDGLELIRRINQSGKARVAVIVLTGQEAEDARVGGLDLGADDYIVKPCSARELVARIRAVWRRVGPASRILTLGNLTVDPAAHQVYISGRRVEVTATEFALLLTLMEHAGEVVRTNAIMKQVWDFPVSHDLLRMTVYRLRRKIEPDPKNPRYIHTAQGVGFMMRDDDSR